MTQPTEMQQDEKGAGIKVIPPMVALGLMVISMLLHLFVPAPLTVGSAAPYMVGLIAAAVGIALVGHCAGCFREAGNEITPNKPVEKLLCRGIYRISRNPMYLGLMIAYLSFGLLLNNLWAVGSAILLFTYLQFHVIPREESYLTRAFGEDYLNYKTQTKRWL